MIKKLDTVSHIAEGSRIRGDLYFFADAEVYGTVEGNIHQESLEHLAVGPLGWVHGHIHAEGPVIVGGRVDGEIRSSTLIRILPTARIDGNLSCPTVEVQPGAIVNGQFDSQPTSSTRLVKAA